jgi:TetR/AcrR family transcriptional regulator, transcriptional repressor for nem operon
MVRPRQFDPGDVEAALLDVFWSRGYARTSIDDLSDATGLQRGSLYAAYEGKEAMFRAAARRYVAQLTAALASDTKGLAGAQHVLETVARLTVRDPERRGCLILNTIPEAHALSADTREELDAALRSMRALFRARLREAQAEAGTAVDLDPLVALLFAASVAIRVLGRAGQDRRLLQSISDGAIEAARRWFDSEKE